jgi:hypothetical protein
MHMSKLVTILYMRLSIKNSLLIQKSNYLEFYRYNAIVFYVNANLPIATMIDLCATKRVTNCATKVGYRRRAVN